MNFSLKLHSDVDGYVSFECPFCGAIFKLNASEYQDDEQPFTELYCVYCGLSRSPSKFYSKEAIEAAYAIVQNYAADLLNASIGKAVHDINRKKSIVRMEYTPMNKVNVPKVGDKETHEVIFQCSLCGKHFKAEFGAGEAIVYCPYCGVNI